MFAWLQAPGPAAPLPAEAGGPHLPTDAPAGVHGYFLGICGFLFDP